MICYNGGVAKCTPLCKRKAPGLVLSIFQKTFILMDYAIIDYCIVYLFLLVILALGWWSGRSIKSMRSYAVADKCYGTGTLVFTYMATNFAGASLINGAAQVFANGIIVTAALLGLAIKYVLIGLFVAPKVAAFDKALTMGDLMEQFYGANSKLIAGTLGLMTSICIASMEMIVLGIVFESLLGVKASWGVCIGGITLALYSAHGGIKSVTITDVLQFSVLIVAIPLTAVVVVRHAGGIPAMLAQVPSEKFEILHHEKFSYYFMFFLMWSFIPAGMIDPAIIQRLLMGKRADQLRKQYLIMAGISPCLRLIIMLIGLSGVVLYPHIEATKLFPHIIEELLPVGIKGLSIAGVLAVSTSTIDSYLHVSGLTFAHDVLKPICEKRNIEINELHWARYSTLFIGLLAVGIGAAGAGATTDTILGFALTALGFTGPLLMFPLLSGLMGLKTDARAFYIALWATVGAYGMAHLLLPSDQSHFTILISIAANGLAFFGVHLVQHRGFALAKGSD